MQPRVRNRIALSRALSGLDFLLSETWSVSAVTTTTGLGVSIAHF